MLVRLYVLGFLFFPRFSSTVCKAFASFMYVREHEVKNHLGVIRFTKHLQVKRDTLTLIASKPVVMIKTPRESST